MKITKSILAISLCLYAFSTFGQVSSCVNADFELGNFSGWQGQLGYCCPIATSPSGIVSGRHTIMTGTGTDPNTCDNITVVAPGGLYSARLGNDNVNSQAEKLSYSVTVSATNSIFIYKYAVVLQDPGHDPSEQPRFQLRVLNAAGALIDPTCGEYTVVASSALPGFQTCFESGEAVVYKDWTTVGLDLSSYSGQTLTIEFATGDCTPGGHFGYAYVDAYCSPPSISSTYCNGSFSAVLTAPVGFTYLWSTGETTQSINVDGPVDGQNFSCVLTSVTGCQVTISTSLEPVDPLASFTLTNTCYNDAIFTQTSFTPENTILDQFFWDFGDGTTSTEENPVHVYASVGTYTVFFSISNGIGCDSSVTQTVTVYPAPTSSIIFPSSDYCTTVTTPQNVNLTGTGQYINGTFSALPSGLTLNSTTGEIVPSTSTPGSYIVSYQIPTIDGCTVPPSTAPITITASPTAAISYVGSPFCTSLTAAQNVALSGTATYTGGTFSAPAGLAINSTTGAITPSSSSDGIYTVLYSIAAIGGCNAQSATTTIQIQQAPTASIAYSSPVYCTRDTGSKLIALSGTGAYTSGIYTASPAGLNLNATTGSIIPSASLIGTYTVTYTIPTIGNCVGITVFTVVKINPTPIASSVTDSAIICSGQNTGIHLSSNVLGTTFSWTAVGSNISGATAGSGNNITDLLMTVADAPGSVTYTVTPTAAGCDGAPITVTIAVNQLPLPSLTGAVLCINPDMNVVERDYTFNAGLDDVQYDFAWYLNNALIPNHSNNLYTATEVGMYGVVATNTATGCASIPVEAEITATYSAQYMSTSGYDAFAVNQIVIVTVYGNNTYEFQLDDDDFQSSNIFNNVSLGIHTIHVRDIDGCTDLKEDILVVDYPRFFTPNADGNNDTWNIRELAVQPHSTISILDRQGKLITVISPKGAGWDGTYNGKELPSSDYWFIVDYNERNMSKQFRSHFSLKR